MLRSGFSPITDRGSNNRTRRIQPVLSGPFIGGVGCGYNGLVAMGCKSKDFKMKRDRNENGRFEETNHPTIGKQAKNALGVVPIAFGGGCGRLHLLAC
jgi:hypothetical protein